MRMRKYAARLAGKILRVSRRCYQYLQRRIKSLAEVSIRHSDNETPAAPLRKYPAQVAWRTLAGNTAARWPSRTQGLERISPFAKPEITDPFELSRSGQVFTIGSCFARNMEEHLIKRGFDVPCGHFSVPKSEWPARPNGILNKYNPFSMLYELEWALGVRAFPFDRGFYELDAGQFIDLQLLGNPVSLERAIERRRQVENLFAGIVRASSLIITLGLAEAWWDRDLGVYTNSTVPQKLVNKWPGRFELHVLSYDNVRQALFAIMNLITARAPSIKKVILTVSPVPLSATFTPHDVMVANTYSKSVLRAVVEEALASYPLASYFPSYESVVLSDREAAWNDDLIHVTNALVAWNVGRLKITAE